MAEMMNGFNQIKFSQYFLFDVFYCFVGWHHWMTSRTQSSNKGWAPFELVLLSCQWMHFFCTNLALENRWPIFTNASLLLLLDLTTALQQDGACNCNFEGLLFFPGTSISGARCTMQPDECERERKLILSLLRFCILV